MKAFHRLRACVPLVGVLRKASLSTQVKAPTGAAAAVSKTNERTVTLYFYEGSTGDRIKVAAPIGKSVLDVALDNNVDIEGACGGELACSTCHVVLTKDLYDKLPGKKEEEEDMLDLAQGLTDTSRLCCQIKVSDLLEGQELKIPKT